MQVKIDVYKIKGEYYLRTEGGPKPEYSDYDTMTAIVEVDEVDDDPEGCPVVAEIGEDDLIHGLIREKPLRRLKVIYPGIYSLGDFLSYLFKKS